MSDLTFYIVSGILTAGFLLGIAWMGKIKTAVPGNALSAACVGLAVVMAAVRYELFLLTWAGIILIGTGFGVIWAARVKMIAMPQTVALFNGFGGAASAIVGIMTVWDNNVYIGRFDSWYSSAMMIIGPKISVFELVVSGLAIAIGVTTLTGSLIAAAKLSGKMKQKPAVWPWHQAITTVALVLSAACAGLAAFRGIPAWAIAAASVLFSGFFGIAFAIRVGGADMPITISLLNSLSGVAVSAAGMAVGDPLLVATGGIVGAAGLILTQNMCKAMNRSLREILTGRTAGTSPAMAVVGDAVLSVPPESVETGAGGVSPPLQDILKTAKRVIIVPGYGMALAQAQTLVKELADALKRNGASVDFAVHPVAGRMPGHMNVLLAEAGVPYEELREMDDVNPEFAECDVAIVVGANDVVNPAARSAEGTPIFGMPILSVDEAKHVILCNFDRKPGYAGVDNPLYDRPNASPMLGNAADTVKDLIAMLEGGVPIP
jgi:NAD(P) transhydrogenase subunit beta